MDELQVIWGWQPALYLFLGGMGAGAFVAASIVYLMDRTSHKRTICAAMWAATICLGVGLLLLLSELIHPLRGLLLWQSFSNFSSWMAVGAWVVLAAVMVFGLSALLSTGKFSSAEGTIAVVRKVLAIGGVFLGFGVAAYTGILLMTAPGIPLWNTAILPFLFTVSALDTGVALVEIIAVVNAKKEPLAARPHRFLSISVVVLVVLELIVLFFFIQTMLAGNKGSTMSLSSALTAVQSIALLTDGSLSPFFWGLVVVCGLILPLAVAITGLLLQRRAKDKAPKELRQGNVLTVAGAAGALVGGCALRFLILMAGLHADYVADSAASIFADMLSRIGF